MQVVEEAHSAGCVLGRRRGHRVDRDCAFAALELVDGADAHAGGKSRLDRGNVRVVRRDDDDLVERERARDSVVVGPGSTNELIDKLREDDAY